MNPFSREHRVMGLVQAARRLADPSDPHGLAVRRSLLASSSLSPEGLELALTEHLETQPTAEEVHALVHRAGSAPAVHVLLSSNVFTAALRAMALAVAAAPQVFVRVSRREPSFPQALVHAIKDSPLSLSIHLRATLDPQPGDELHLYGHNRTLLQLCQQLPPDVWVRAHGAGLGLAGIGLTADLTEAAQALAQDLVPFDQRGCLSPRIALVAGPVQRARELLDALAPCLMQWNEQVPVGRLSVQELSERTRFRRLLTMVGEVRPCGDSAIGLVERPRTALLPPVGRNLLLIPCPDGALEGLDWLIALQEYVAALGLMGTSTDPFCQALSERFPGARQSELGWMQRPAFDGPVDLRHPDRYTPEQLVTLLAAKTLDP